jgi:hypothetical protein
MDFTAYHYVDAILPQKFVVCGIELKPFCLGHYLLLERSGNPFISPTPEPASINENTYFLFHALLVCALSFEDNIKILEDDMGYKELADKFLKNLTDIVNVKKDWNIIINVKLFEKYMRYYMDMPLYTEENQAEAGVPSGTDWKQTIFIVFKKLGYSDTEILNMNFKKLFYEWSSVAEGEGGLKVWNSIDIEQYKKLQKGKT